MEKRQKQGRAPKVKGLVKLADIDDGHVWQPQVEAGDIVSDDSPLVGDGISGPVLADVLNVCPQIADYARDGISNWRDMMQTADLVRSMLGISRDAWVKAHESMGDIGAATTIAAILERSEEIRSPGGYLRKLTEKAGQGRFSTRPMLEALRNRETA